MKPSTQQRLAKKAEHPWRFSPNPYPKVEGETFDDGFGELQVYRNHAGEKGYYHRDTRKFVKC